MKVKVNEALKSFDGKPLKDVDANGQAVDATIRTAMINALLSPVQKESGLEKVKKYKLAQKIYDGDEIDLDVDEIKLIKDRIGEVYPPVVVGQVYEILEV